MPRSATAGSLTSRAKARPRCVARYGGGASTDTLTITRNAETGGSNQNIAAGFQVAAMVTKKTLTDIEALLGGTTTASSADVTVPAEALWLRYIVNAEAANRKVKLPASPVANQIVSVRGIYAASHTVTIEGNGQEIEGATTLVLSATGEYASVELVWDGTSKWRIF